MQCPTGNECVGGTICFAVPYARCATDTDAEVNGHFVKSRVSIEDTLTSEEETGHHDFGRGAYEDNGVGDDDYFDDYVDDDWPYTATSNAMDFVTDGEKKCLLENALCIRSSDLRWQMCF